MAVSRRSFLAFHGAALGAAFVPGKLLAEAIARTEPMPKAANWADVRAMFRFAPEYRHFSGFYIASHPTPVRQAVEAFRDALDANPFLVVERGMFESEAQNLQLAVCDEAARYLGVRAQDIALTPNTTTGLALVYHGLPLAKGDEVLATTHDHVVHHESIRLACERSGASWRRVPLFEAAATATTEGIVSRIREALRPETRVLGITWVHSASGIRLPVRAIADAVAEANAKREPAQRIRIVLDGVHGLGCSDVDLPALGCDYFSGGTHKWMFAPRGTGVLWAHEAAWAALHPTIPSFSELESYLAWQENRPPNGPTVAARVAPGGFQAYEHQWGMAAAFRMHRELGRTRVATRVAELNGRIKDGLAKLPRVVQHTPRDAAMSAGICCFEVDGMAPEAVVAKLLEKKIVASTSPYAKPYARLSAGIFNTEAEVDEVLAALRQILS
ncbi:MAG TPA: aminotransferase class V-fold PLP-dependent enzyme [Xanthomonadales bacterium]|nr:aminotransferase class V-fold PLP-dependent enzyme [Xanthomonadales bacterium]